MRSEEIKIESMIRRTYEKEMVGFESEETSRGFEAAERSKAFQTVTSHLINKHN